MKNAQKSINARSLKVYLGLEKDDTGLLDEAFIMQYFSNNVKEARRTMLN